MSIAAAHASASKLAGGGLLIALGVLLPQAVHLTGGPASGAALLPMHLPVLLGGFCLGPLYGGVVGALTPAISCLLTGMPAPASLLFMMAELAVYGVAAGLLYRRLRWPLAPALLLAQIAGRTAKALLLWAAAGWFQIGQVGAALAVFADMGKAIPGLIVQWAAIPLLLLALRKGRLLDGE